MTVWNPPRESVRIKNGVVLSVAGKTAVVRVDGGRSASMPVYGSVAVGAGVLVLEQGAALLAVGPNNLVVGNEALSVKGGAADATWIGFYPDAEAQASRWAWIGYGSAGSTELRITNDKGAVVLKGSPDVTVDGAGITYPGATNAGGTANRIGMRWNSPNITASVDNVVSAVIGVVSTGRLKTNVKAVAGAVETVLQLRPVVYTPLEIDGTQRADAGTHIGLIAEEVAQVVPSAVLHSEGGEPLSVNYQELLPLALAAVAELAARVAALEEGV